MIVRTFIAGADVSSRIMKGEGAKISVNVEDADGKQSISTASFALSNLRGSVNALLLGGDRIAARIDRNSTTLFSGFFSPVDVDYNPRTKILQGRLLNSELHRIQRLKSLTFSDRFSDWRNFPNTSTKAIYNAPTGTTSANRYFYPLNLLLGYVAREITLDWTNRSDFNDLYVGGTKQGSAFVPCHTWNLFQFLTNVATTLNCLWRLDVLNYRLELVPKQTLVGGAVAEFTLPAIKDSVRIEPNSVGADSVSFTYANDETDNNAAAIAHTLTKATSPLSVSRESSTEFLCPADGVNNTFAHILDDDGGLVRTYDNSSIFLLKSTGDTPTLSRPLAARDVLENYWRVELLPGNRITGDYLIRYLSDANVQKLSNAFFLKFGSPVHFVTNAEIDFRNNVARITGVQFI